MNKETQPLVSIAIITYNQKEFLRECIDSCLEQDYENTEIVVADDGSTDGTQDMLREYEKRYPGKFVLCLSPENQGITKNSNLAHFACSGKYIAWMGGDDLMLPGKISAQVMYLEANPNCSIVYHDLDVFDSDANETLYIFSKTHRPREGDVSVLIEHGVFNGACSNMVRAAKAPKSGFNPLLPVASDWFYWIETLNNGGTIDYINIVLGRYRRHKNNTTKRTAEISNAFVDRLNTVGLIIKLRPDLIEKSLKAYAHAVVSNRHSLPYFSAVFFALKNKFKFKYIFAIFIYFLSFGRVKC